MVCWPMRNRCQRIGPQLKSQGNSESSATVTVIVDDDVTVECLVTRRSGDTIWLGERGFEARAVRGGGNNQAAVFVLRCASA